MFLYDKLCDRFIEKLEKTIEKKLLQQTEILRKDITSQISSFRKDVETRSGKVEEKELNRSSKLLPRNNIQHLDYHLTTHCNLNCKGCSVFSPIAKEWFAAPEEFKKEIEALRKALDGASPVNIHLLGGGAAAASAN